MKKLHCYQVIIDFANKAVSSDSLMRRTLFFILNLVLALTSLIMSIVNIFTSEYILMCSTFIFTFLCILNTILIRVLKELERVLYFIFEIEAIILLGFFVISGIPNGFSALWVCLIPSFSLLIFGVKTGSLFSLLALAMMIFLFWIPAGNSILMYSYSKEFMLRFPIFYTSLYVISLLIECLRKETQNQLEFIKQKYWYLYRHDALTGLFNRYGIKEYIDEAFKKNDHVSVILFDIDNFKNINDLYGHDCGDEVLKAVSTVPISVMCNHCQCCRWGGEEFLLIMECNHNAFETAEKIRHKVENMKIPYKEEKIKVTVSVGICIAEDLTKTNAHDVIDIADKALYKSKLSGKNCVTVYNTDDYKSAVSS